ncbi:topless-related protein [Trifolium repens]|nr:topless-related protein [Trifolium repens]
MVKLLLSRARRQVKISRLIYTNSGDSILALASNTIHLPWIWPRNDHNSSSKNGDARNMVDVKSRISEGSNDKSKIWKLIEINEPSHCRSLKLPENVKVNKISRLIYTNSGNAILALASNAIHLLWKWPRNDRNSSSMANASVQPQLWQPSSGIMMTNDIAHSNPEDSVPCFALSKNDSYVMSASGGKISLFNMMTFKTMTTFMPPPPAATFLAFHPQDNNIIAIGMDDSSIQIYNVRVDEVKSKLKGHTKRITGLAFSHVLNVLVSSGADAQICVWNTDGWEKQKTRFLQLPPGRTPSAQSDTRVQFHQDQIQFLVVHETQLSIFEATECLKQISRLIYTNYGDSILALASNTIHLPWIWPRNDHNSSSKNGDARNTGDVKPRISEGSNDKSKIWKLTEINEPSHCRSLKLPENVKVNKLILRSSELATIGAIFNFRYE